MKVRFTGFVEGGQPENPWFTVGSIYTVTRAFTSCDNPHVWVTDDTGEESPIFAAEYEIVEA